MVAADEEVVQLTLIGYQYKNIFTKKKENIGGQVLQYNKGDTILAT